MKTLLAVTAVLALSGCASFKLGGVAYCPHGQSCSFQMLAPANITFSPAPAEIAPPVPEKGQTGPVRSS